MMRAADDDVAETLVDIRAPEPIEPVRYFDAMSQSADILKGYLGLSQYTRRKINKASASSQSAELAYHESTGYGLFALAEPPYNLEELSTFYDTSPVNHAAIAAKVSSVVGLGYSFSASPEAVDKIQSKTTPEAVARASRKIDSFKVAMKSWLDAQSDEDTFQQILEKVAVDYEVYGNGYFEVGRTVTGQIGFLGHIPASTIRVRLKRDGFIQIVGNRISFFRNFGASGPSPLTTDERPNEIIHIKKYSPKSSFYGVPDSVACATAIVGDALASQYNVKFFDNSATPRSIVTMSGARLSARAEEKLFKFLQSSLRGNPHRTLFIPLPLDSEGNPVEFKINKVDSESVDSSWETYRDRNKQDILLAHGVPLSRVGGANENNTATSLSSDRMFKEQVVLPTQRIFEKAIGRIVREITDAVVFDLNELTLIDETAESQLIERYLRNHAMRINEARERIGLPSIPEGDEFFEASPQTRAEQNAQANGSRERDRDRSANNSDSHTTIAGRNPKGSGPKE
jgi:PBSX family phage portal protein